MNIIPLVTYAIIASFTPGPNNILSMTHARNMGFRKTLPFIGGVAAGCLLIMFLCSYFNLILHQYIPRITPILNLLGCVYMLYLAIKMMRSTPKDAEENNKNQYSFLFGFTLQFINPKVILYGLTAISVFVLPLGQSHVQLIVFSFLLTLIGISANMTWAFGGLLFQNFLLKYERPVNMVMGILLIYSALSILM
ncbi:lysine transporter LysE [Paenibacillus sp. PCH8]|uniref:LysE family transporter n=1 Tax=Paenibacillus sp. PCH8 TaxID=2066524 RepID=UPI000CFA5A88|nr:LysE family transporter [Paenibacillus sp. PCH8]PQP81270.1 lysine transporter LysE [Paenibacillus sp. PCH8]